MRYLPRRRCRLILSALVAWTAEGSAEEHAQVGIPEVLPQTTFLRHQQPAYRNYAFQNFSNFPNHAFPYTDAPLAHYSSTGDYLITGYELYNWTEQRMPSLEWGSSIYKERMAWDDAMSYLVMGRDGYGSWNYSALVGDGLIARFTPLTLSMVDFNGMRFDLAVPHVKFTALGSRIERPHFLRDWYSVEDPFYIDGTVFATDSSLLLGSRLETDLGTLRLGLNGANLHVYESTLPGNSIKGALRSRQRLTEWVIVRFADDAPADGRGGAVVQEVQLIVNGEARPDLSRGAIRHRADVSFQVGTISQRTGAFTPRPYYQPNPGYRPFYRGREEFPAFADYLYRLDHEAGIDVSKNTNLSGLVEHFVLESPEAVQRVDGEEQLVYLFDVSQEHYVESVEVEAVVGNDYRVEVATLSEQNSRGAYETRLRSTYYQTVLRAAGHVQDMSNLKRVRFHVGESTAIFTYSADLNLQLAGLEVSGEYARSAVYGRYPAQLQGEPVFGRSPRYADRGSAYFINATRWFGRWNLGAEYFAMNPGFKTTMQSFVPHDRAVTYRRSTINGLTNETIYWDLVQDNEDGDAFPDKQIGLILGRSAFNQVGGIDSDGVYLNQDEDNDGFPDTNRNRNGLPDHTEPFLMYAVEPNEYVYGLDRNNNDEPDQREDDPDVDHPYDPDQRGFHLFAQVDLTQRWSLGAGGYAVEEIAGTGRNHSDYGLLTYRREGVAGLRRLYFENHVRRVQDDIADEYNLLAQGRHNLGVWRHISHGVYDSPRVYLGQVRPDPLLYQDSYVNESYLETRLRPWSTLNLVQKLRLRINWQQGGRLHNGLFQRQRRLDHWTGVSKVDYTWHLGKLSLQPKFKFIFLRFVDQEADQIVRSEFELIPIVQLTYLLMRRTTLRAGVQGLGPLPYRFEDRAREHQSFERRTLTATATNRSSYFGYDLFTIVGFNKDQMEFDDRFSKAGNFDEWTFFVRALIGFTQYGGLL